MYLPPGFNNITLYFLVQDAQGFLDFLRDGLQGSEVLRHMDQGRIAHAQVRIGHSTLMLCEATSAFPPMPTAVYLYVADVAQTVQAALAAGASQIMDITDMPYNDRQGGVRDRWGNIWWISQRLVEGPY